DVPDFGPTTTVEGIADCVNDVVVQDAEGNVTYQPPSDVDLVDDGDYDVPIQSSMGRVIEDPTPKKAADKKGRLRLLGIDVPMKETIGQPLFPVRIRIAQGHNSRLVDNEEADYLLATAWYSNLDTEEAESNMPVEIAIDTFKAMAAGCEFFVTDSDGTLTRNTVPPDCIVSAVDTTKKD
ncbi:unnamed protein product, partial [Symbiodinium sp. KB8]